MSTTSSRDGLRIYTWVLCAIAFVGEAATLALTNKYLPQGMDEFAFVACMLVLTLKPLTPTRLTLMFGAWWFMVGSLYTMFFSRLDPHGGSGERLAGLVIFMAACVIGAAWTYRRQQPLPRS
jgi:hypothetical protein